jgi:NADH-quinone oxidoreductase subunit L
MFFLEHIWIVPLLPLAGAAVMFLFGRRWATPAPAGGGHHAHDDHGPSPADTAKDVHAAHGPADAHAHASGHAERAAPERLPKSFVNAVCVGAVVLAFAWSCLAVWQYGDWTKANKGAPYDTCASYSQSGCYLWLGTETGHTFYKGASGFAPFQVEAGFLLDPLSAIWLLFVTGVGMLIHIYSTGYMAHEGGYYRFFGYLNLFMFSMLTLILGNNYALMFVGWEGVGLCSYLLIGFYFLRHSASTAANKAFIVNRIGDAGFILGMFTIAWYFGSFKYATVLERAAVAVDAGTIDAGVLTFATLMLFVGACGKSAQIPLYIWLPDAMEGPTPVSALIHAATMVTAGIYMVARSSFLFALSPDTMQVVVVVGATTAFVAASIGLVQNDIKRVLAYSTVSQLGYMFLALGIGAFAAGVFHVFTHAFFKALLFLGSGAVIHAMSGEQDMRNMGALRDKIPTTYRTMLIGTLAIAGIFPLAGFVSKDEILWQAWSSHEGAYRLFWGIGFLTAIMTAFYMFRLIWLTFYGQPRMSAEVEHHIHESPKSMTVPLMILAFFSIVAGFLGWPKALFGSNRFEHYLEPVFGPTARLLAKTAPAHVAQGAAETAHHDPTEYALMTLSVAVAIGAGWLAYRVYGKAGKGYREPIEAGARPVYDVLYNKYYVDEAYDYAFTGRRKVGGARLGAMGLGDALWKFDANVIDGGVNGAGWLTKLAGTLSTWWDKWVIDGLGVNGPAIVTRVASYPVRLFQWGQVQWYALVMVGGLIGFIAYYVWR